MPRLEAKLKEKEPMIEGMDDETLQALGLYGKVKLKRSHGAILIPEILLPYLKFQKYPKDIRDRWKIEKKMKRQLKGSMKK